MDDEFNINLTYLKTVSEDTLSEKIKPPKQVALEGLSKPERMQKLREMRKAYNRRHRKKYTRKRGTVHPKKREATRKRSLRKRWAERPFSCVIHGYGSYDISKELWDRWLQPFWEQYPAEELQIKKRRKDLDGKPLGYPDNPYTIYSLILKHKSPAKAGTRGRAEGSTVLWDGWDQLVYDLSCPS